MRYKISIIIALYVFSVGFVAAHPGPTDSSGGHFRDAKKRTGYHRHSSPLYQTNYATEQISEQDKYNNNNGRLNPSSLKSDEELLSSFNSESPLRRMLRERERVIKQASKAREAKEQAKFDYLARVISRAGREIVANQCRNINLFSDGFDITKKQLAIYRFDKGSFFLIGRARVIKATEKHIECYIQARSEEVNPHKYKAGPYYLSDRPYGEEARGLTEKQFIDVLHGKVWKGLPLNVFSPIFGKADRVTSHTGSWGNESTYHYDRPVFNDTRMVASVKVDSHRIPGRSKMYSYHFRNGYLTSWKETK